MPTLATKNPMRRAGEEAEAEADGERERPGDAELHVDEHDEQRHRDAARDAGGQVDLAEEEDEHQRHAEHHERGRLGQQVREVALGEEERAQEVNRRLSTIEPADSGQGAHVAAADALDQARTWSPRPPSSPLPMRSLATGLGAASVVVPLTSAPSVAMRSCR